MKRVGHLYEQIIDIENIKLAIHNASARKKNRTSVKRVLEDVDKSAQNVQRILMSGEYKPSPYYVQHIIDNSSSKHRQIFKPMFYPDQIIHWAVMQVIQPVLFKGMYHYSCGSIPGRGGAHGRKALKRWLEKDPKNTKYCLQIDVSKFYPSIDQAALKRMLRQKIKDDQCLSILGSIIDSTESGLPIGNYTSQWLANFYLDGLDHFIKEELKVKYYIRYMDDGVLFGPNKKRLHQVRREIVAYLSTIGLSMKGSWQVFKVNARPVDFLGFRFYRTHITLRRRNALRIRRRVRKVARKSRVCFRDAAAILSYLGWIYHSNSYGYMQKYILPQVNIKKLKGVVRLESRKQHNAAAAIHGRRAGERGGYHFFRGSDRGRARRGAYLGV